MIRRRELLAAFPASAAVAGTALAQTAGDVSIRQVDIIHHTHTDVGYTDLPSVCRDLQRRFLDAALDTCLNDTRFRWTIESMLGLDDWWRAARPERRNQLLELIASGRMDAMALPFNQAPCLNQAQWDQMFTWVDDQLWKGLRIRAGMQNDVNGFPRAGAMRLLDRGIGHLLMGINADSGGPPFRRPSAFWWKMPDGRRLFVWMGDHYGTAYSFFEANNWIRQQPRSAQTEYHPPHTGEIHRTDESSLRQAHAQFLTKLQKLKSDGYSYDRLILSYTNQWRYDNDPPFPPLPDFVDAWNNLKLDPPLRLTTATEAVLAMERSVGSAIPEHSGEWTDWWANGVASGPREVTASRYAKRYLAAAASPVWGAMPEEPRPTVKAMYHDLCLFDEHTWGANISVSQPYDLQSLGQFNEKSLLAYRPMGHAEALVGRRARTATASMGEGLFVCNTAPKPFTGWVSFAAGALRGDFKSLEDRKTRRTFALTLSDGRARFWVDALPPRSITHLQLRSEPGVVQNRPERVVIATNEQGWPRTAQWPEMPEPLFSTEFGNFLTAQVNPPANRGTPQATRRKSIQHTEARYLSAKRTETAQTTLFTQEFQHPRLDGAARTLELHKEEPRAHLSVRFNRTSSLSPEVFYLAFGFPAPGALPVFTNGGVPFTPYRDQLTGTCCDYYAIDSWAEYRTGNGNWLWITRDAPLVSVGGPHTLARRTTPPDDSHRLLAMVFDNMWHTNFVADSHGWMEFQFEAVWKREAEDPDAWAETLTAEPVVVINSAAPEFPVFLSTLFRP